MKRIRVIQLFIVIAWFAIGVSVLRTMVTSQLRTNLLKDGDDLVVYSLDGSRNFELDSSTTPNLRWRSSFANPPLSPRVAVRIASDFFERNATTKNDGDWGIGAISLLPIDSQNESWLWAVSIQYTGKDFDMSEPIYVSMDGAVINPTSLPSTEPTPTIDEPDIFEIYGEARSAKE